MNLTWSKVPQNMRNDYVKHYFSIIEKKKFSLLLKRIFDVVMSTIMIILLSPIIVIIAIIIVVDSNGPVFYRQERVTQYGKVFKVYKFRTMVDKADKIGSHVTVNGDNRITRVGNKIRASRIDELPQLFNVFKGEMSFVGTRPEAIRYVEKYTDEMKATLLLPAGVTSMASIKFKDEALLLDGVNDPDSAYVNDVLPKKMEYNLDSLRNFNIWEDIKIMLLTVKAVLR